MSTATAPELANGTALGPYEIVAFIGRGGMGEVYRARDTRLNRAVALKILPRESSDDPTRRQRFMREARILSAISHPHIAGIHDVGEHEGRVFLVMDFVDGERLDIRLARRPLPVARAVTFAIQIAEALDAAHRQGFVHRDLKPGNLIVTPAGVKLIDFGIASLWREPLDPIDQSMATTASDAASVPGTTAYVSPEQLEGRPADPRSDLFAVGIVLYEMLTGHRPFGGTTRAGLIAAILERPPEPLTLPDGPVPPALEHLVTKCLEKDPDARWQTARDLSGELAWVLHQLGRQAGPQEASSLPVRRLAAVVGVVAVAALGLAWASARFRASPAPPPVVRFIVSPPAGVVTAGTAAFTLSPDGRHLAFVGSSRGGPSLVWIQALDSYVARPIAGTDDAWHPFWSHDGRSVGFFAGGKLKTATIDGIVRTLADVPQAGRASHGSWGRGVVLFNAGTSLWHVPDEGGEPIQIKMDMGDALVEGASPFESDFLPDGRHFLFRMGGKASGTSRGFIGSVDGGPIEPLIGVDSQLRFLDSGHLLFMRNGDLVVQRFDPDTRRVSGQPVHVPEPVSFSTRLSRGIFSAARRDVLAYEAESTPTELVWYDRVGRRIGVLAGPGLYTNPALAPDGRRVAVTRFDPSVGSSDIWLVEPGRGERALTLTQAAEDYPVWSTNARSVIYASDSSGRMQMYEKPADASASTDDGVPIGPIAAVDDNWPLDWAPRPGVVVFQGANRGIPRRLFALSMLGPDRESVPVILRPSSGPALQEEAQAQVSPDGRWMAYTADLGRSPQVYVKAFPDGGSVAQVSTTGGFEPKWRGDGRELFYVAPDRTIMSVAIRCQDKCTTGTPQPLFRVAALGAPLRKGTVRNEYAVTTDGERFLVNEPVDGTSAYGIHIVVNWQSGLQW
jgi:Tol biopolymer transport system component